MKTPRKGPSGSTPRGPRRQERRPEPPGIALPAGAELIWGRNAVREALRAGRRVRRLLVAEGARKDLLAEDAIRLARQMKLPVQEVDRGQLDALAPDHQGLVAVANPFEYADWSDLLRTLTRTVPPPAVLLVDTVQDPQNLGTLLRTAEAVALDAIVLPTHRAVHVTPAVVRSSAGAVEHLRVTRVANLSRAVEQVKEAGLWVAGIDVDGDRIYWELDMTGPTALVLGGEDRGIGRLLKEKCDFLVRLPMAGSVNSLNAAVAGSVVLYEMMRQRLKQLHTPD